MPAVLVQGISERLERAEIGAGFVHQSSAGIVSLRFGARSGDAIDEFEEVFGVFEVIEGPRDDCTRAVPADEPDEITDDARGIDERSVLASLEFGSIRGHVSTCIDAGCRVVECDAACVVYEW